MTRQGLKIGLTTCQASRNIQGPCTLEAALTEQTCHGDTLAQVCLRGRFQGHDDWSLQQKEAHQ